MSDDELRRAAGQRPVDVADLVAEAEIAARAEALERLRGILVDDLLRRAAAYLGGERGTVHALVGVGDGVRPIVRELDRAALADERALERLVREHNDALLAELADGAVLPFRFGTTFPDRESLDAWVAERRDELAAALARVRGRAEWSVEIVARPADDAPDAYLEARLATAVRPDVRARLAEVSDERSGDAYLVALDRQDEFDAALAELEREGYSLRVSGPWPPYAFATLP